MANFKRNIEIGKSTNIITIGQVSSEKSQGGKVYSVHGHFPTLCSCTHGYALGFIQDHNLIRRIMPLETARLMGFDDEDVYKCEQAKISPTQLYKMFGNSIVVNILEFIFSKLFIDYKRNSFSTC